MDLKEKTSTDLKEETSMDSEEEASMYLKEETSMNSEEEASIDLEEEASMDLKKETSMNSEEASMDLKEETSMNSEEEASIDSEEETSTDSAKTSIDPEAVIIIICPRVEASVELREGRFHLGKTFHGDPKEIKCEANTNSFKKLLQEEGTKYVYCKKCYGNGHQECYKSSPFKHPLHPRHTLLFVKCYNDYWMKKCLCCEEPLERMFYWCPSCDFCINLTCVGKQPLITIDHPKRHEHTLTLFPRQVTTICNVCALDHSRIGSIYICPACDFVVHKSCIYLPWTIRISRHPQHRISFTSCFAVGDRVCNICRRKIKNGYGGYICNKEGCSYFAHSKCATGKNVWDGEELEGVPEEVEEEVNPPFERLGDGSIRHFSHEHHPLKLSIEDTTRDYDEYRICEACVMPIYYGNFYSCTLDCCFTLHEACANLSRRTYHDIHPHPLLLRVEPTLFECSACKATCIGFFYECCRKECFFQLHVQCATVYEPLVHNSHVHSLFLTSAPEECRRCSICNGSGLKDWATNETFNCIESECEFSLCYKCAVIPQKVRYKHDDHILTLLYGEDTSEIQNWCELCEMKIKKCERFYACEDCCVTLHIECLLGRDREYKLGSYWSFPKQYDVIPNGMTRPVCSTCHKRCNQKFIFQLSRFKCCSYNCMTSRIYELL